MFKKILLPVDHMEYDEKTLEFVKDYALKNGSTVVVFHAQDTSTIAYWGGHPVMMGTEPPKPDDIAKNPGSKSARLFEGAPIEPLEASEDIVNTVAQPFVDAGITVEKRTSIGDPAYEILQQLEKDSDIDMIVMNTHGMSATRRFLLGSVTNKVVHHSKIPVMVMR